MEISGIKGIIFDYGGTLDTGGDHWSEVIWAAYQQAGVAVDKAEFREAYVQAERELARTRHILPEHNFGDLLLVKMQLELQWLSEQGLFPPAQVQAKAKEVADICYQSARSKVQEAVPVLEALSKKYKLELVSNFYGNIRTVLEDFGISKFFPKIVESAVVGVRKPDPKIFSLGVEDLGLKPEEVVVVGDSYRKDIEPAIKLGCKAIWIKGKGWTAEEDAQTFPNTITDIRQLETLLL
ncbi:MAG: HAD family hydrolase [Bacteroides sp.]|nr:HAD family hydrolase [Bacteroides sp.]